MTIPKKLLIVDDDETFCRILARSLGPYGIETAAAHDAERALALAEAFRPDGISLDLKLGEDNGLQLIQALRDACPEARIVLATGFASIATAVDAIHRGAWNYLPKPFDVEMLLRAFEYSPEESAPAVPPPSPLSMRRQTWEYQQRVLNECGGNISAAARVLGIDRRTLQRRLAKRPARERGGG